MIKSKVVLPILIVTLMLTGISLAFAEDYYLYDPENKVLLGLSKSDNSFIQAASNLSKPEAVLVDTVRDKCYLVKRTAGSNKQKKEKEAGSTELVILNIKTNQIETTAALGVDLVKWIYTANHSQLFFAYTETLDGRSCGLLHYNAETGAVRRLSALEGNVTDLQLAADESRLYLSLAARPASQLITVAFQTELSKGNVVKLAGLPKQIFVLNKERLAVLENWQENREIKKSKPALLELIDPQGNQILESRKLNYPIAEFQWYQTERVLMIYNDHSAKKAKGERFNGKSRIYKVTADGIRFNQLDQAVLDYNYSPEQDVLYALNQKQLTIIDYHNDNLKAVNTGTNLFEGYERNYFYKFILLPQIEVGVIYCSEEGSVKFFDLKQHQVVGRVKSGKTENKIINFFTLKSGALTETYITTSRDSKYFLISNKITRDITITELNSREKAYLELPDEPLVMYKPDSSALGIIVLTKRGIYQFDETTLNLQLIQDFEQPVKQVIAIKETNDGVVIHADRILLLLDARSGRVQNSFALVTDGQKSKNRKGKLEIIPSL